MISSTNIKNWASGNSSIVLDSIHKKEVNIAIYERDVSALEKEIDGLIERDFELRLSGDIKNLTDTISLEEELTECPQLRSDILALLEQFEKVTSASDFRLYLATIKSNMCRKFHTDINDLRMLCTYRGPGTLWLTEDNINRESEDCCDDDDCLVIEKSKIQQTKEGSVVILKGALYPKEGTSPILHRSPTIEEGGIRRLMLRIDTDEFANLN